MVGSRLKRMALLSGKELIAWYVHFDLDHLVGIRVVLIQSQENFAVNDVYTTPEDTTLIDFTRGSSTTTRLQVPPRGCC